LAKPAKTKPRARARPGRPALDPEDPSAKVCVSLPSKQYDAYARRALREDVSVAEIIRRDLAAAKG
jgi:hypothetical protein